jgi:uncharacterized repeat protein (TIGR03803 family)
MTNVARHGTSSGFRTTATIASRPWVRGLLALACAASLLEVGTPAQAAQRQALAGHVPAAVGRQPALRRLPGTNRLDLAIGLPLRNQEALTNLLEQLYNPASPNYHQYLTPGQFEERFAPTEQDYQQVVAFVKAQGLRLTGQHPNRALLEVSGTVADIERAFHLNLKVYRHPKEVRTFYAPDAEPSLDLAVPVLTISGLDDFNLPLPLGLQVTRFDAIPYSTLIATGSGPKGTFWGRDFRAAYAPDVSLDGAGQVVGLVEFDGYYASDIATYASLAGLPNVVLTNVLTVGASGQPGANNIEVALDIDMAMAMAPGLSKVIVYEGRIANIILSRMATDTNSLGQPAARQLSSSWGFGLTKDATRDNLFLRFQAQGQTFFQSSSDDGARCQACPPFPPTDNPFITVVGGTALTTSELGGAWLSESVWSGSGGGVSTNYPMPSWQKGLDMTSNGGSMSNRNFPDVAALADGVIWLIADNGQQYRIAGTSASAPLWAGFAALANQQAALSGQPSIGFINPALYAIGSGSSYGAAFHDVTAGNTTNTCCDSNQFFACPGYDLCTGWGTPNGSNLIAALLAPSDALRILPGTGFMASGPFQGPFSPAVQSYTLTNSGAVSLNWTQVNTSVWLDASPSSGRLEPGGPAVSVTLSLKSAASNLVTGSYAATLWFTNLNDNFGQSRRFTLNVVTPPQITSQPTGLSVLEGMTAAFTVGTASNALLFYQWQYDNGTTLTNLADGVNVSGAASRTLTLSNVVAADAGSYSVILTNAAGATTSSVARLTVNASRPVIATQPASQTVLPGQPVTLSVAAVGSQPLYYLWLKDGNFLTDGGDLSGTATRALGILHVAPEDAGTYSVIVGNSLGLTPSSNAVLTVVPVTPPGAVLASLYSFGGGYDGGNPNGLVQGADGDLYGTAQTGGTNSFGAVFRMTAGGGLTPLYSFSGGDDGANPHAALVRGSHGELYGTTYGGGSNGLGTVFQTGTNGGLVSLVSFDLPGSVLPYSELAPGTDGNYYGTTYGGGAAAFSGTVYRLTPNGPNPTITNLYSFTGGSDGGLPYAGLTSGADGSFYGTTYKGGDTGYGTVFRIAANGALTNLASFNKTNGAFPYARLARGNDGNFYGTTASGGSYNQGTVFRMTPGGALSTLWSFSGGADGASPMAGLLQTADGLCYGTTAGGGNYSDGTVFGITTNGALLTLVQFDGYNGANPQAALIQGTDGKLYGTTRDGGANDKGVAFGLRVTPFPQIARQPVAQAVFTGADVTLTVAVFGSSPLFYQWRKDGTNVLDAGNLSGSTTPTLTLSNVTLANAGTYSVLISNLLGYVVSADAFLAITASPPIITLQPVSQVVSPGATVALSIEALGSLPLSFQWQKNGTNLTDGPNVLGSTTTNLMLGSLVEPDSGTYAVLVSNPLGSNGAAAVLEVKPETPAGTLLKSLHWFTDGDDGGSPNGLMQATNGSFYGTTAFGGAGRSGTVFQMSPDGALLTLAAFGWTNGALPSAALIQGADGTLYGTTEYGGDYDAGTLFALTPEGGLAMRYSFSGWADGANPYAALVQGTDGNLYGTTQRGDLFDEGTIFSLTPAGVLTPLFTFNGDTYGGAPVAALVPGVDGSFYGTTPNGGSNYCGNVFKLTPDGKLTNLYSFLRDAGSFPPVGNHPVAALVRGADGSFYGTTKHSTIMGLAAPGTMFKITPNGVLTSLYAFNSANYPPDGFFPEASLIQGGDGNFYGTTYGGGANGYGTVFRATPGGVVTTLVNFDGFDTGAQPESALVAGADGSFYGTTTAGGLGDHGTVFRLSFAPQIITQPTNQTVLAGTSAAFAVSLFGSQPLFCQWRFNGSPLTDGGNISGSGTSTLTISNVSPLNAGKYSLSVSNALGSITSTGALLAVVSPPVFQTVSQTNGALTLTWSAAPGQTYQLQYKSELASTNWLNLGDAIMATSPAVTASDVIGFNSKRFYRVVLIP